MDNLTKDLTESRGWKEDKVIYTTNGEADKELLDRVEKTWIEKWIYENKNPNLVKPKDWDILSAFKFRANKIKNWPYWIWVYLILVASLSGAIAGGIVYLWIYVINI